MTETVSEEMLEAMLRAAEIAPRWMKPSYGTRIAHACCVCVWHGYMMSTGNGYQLTFSGRALLAKLGPQIRPDEIESLRRENAELLSILREVEWDGERINPWAPMTCPCCAEEFATHHRKCRLAKAIGSKRREG